MAASLVMAMYRPKEGKSDAVRALIDEHYPVLQSQNMVTERRPLVLRSEDGTFIEIFEWISAAVVGEAHKNAAVSEIWNRFEEVCDYGMLNQMPEANTVFPHFELVTG